MSRLVETQIVPRLVAARTAEDTWIGADQVEQLTALLLTGRDEAAAETFVIGFRRNGVPADAILLDLLTPAARRLGDLWSDDRADFTQVTVGASRLQRVMGDLACGLTAAPADESQPAARAVPDPRRALFAAAPGDQHTFGLSMVAEFFRVSGWSVTMALPAGSAAIADAARHASFDLAVLSAGSADRLKVLATTIDMIRASSRNRDIVVLVGGPAFLTASGMLREDAAAIVGADVATNDARQAVRQAGSLVAASAGLADA